MADAQLGPILRHIHKLMAAEGTSRLTDAELLGRFVRHRDEPAFAALLERHGPMVLGVCRRLLPNRQDAEDAFQATFLVFVRKAGSIRAAGSVGSWLYGAACRAATEARRAAVRRRKHETRAAEMARATTPAPLLWADVQTVLDAEILRLPERYRAPFVLCCVEGESIAAAARRLGCRAGTLASRLARARERLRHRLARRGVSLSTSLGALALAGEGVGAPVPAGLAGTTTRAALALAGGEGLAGAASVNAMNLVEGVCKTMNGIKLKIATALLLAVALAAAAAGLLVRGALAQKPARPDRAEQAADAGRAQAEETFTVAGQVMGPDGKPVANAPVTVLRWRNSEQSPESVGAARTDNAGKFSLTAHRPGAATFTNWLQFVAVASAPGQGIVWQTLDAGEDRQEVRLRLAPEQPVRGRIVDLQGKPAAGVRVHVLRVVEGVAGRALVEFAEPPRGIAAWPAAPVTDGEGRFTLRGLGEDLATVRAQVDDARFGRHTLDFKPRAQAKERLRIVAEPARVLEGTVTRADTKRPVKGARVVANSFSPQGKYVEYGHTVTDDQGRYRLHAPHLGRYELNAWPPASTPVLGFGRLITWPRGAVRHRADIALPAGAVVRGKVTEAGTDKPVAGATLHYFPSHPNALRGPWLTVEECVSGPDGTFQLAVVPNVPAHLAVLGPTRDYVEEVTALGKVLPDQEDAVRFYAHALVPLEGLKGGAKKNMAVQLRRGVTVKGRVVRPDGKPAAGAVMLSAMNFWYADGTGGFSRWKFMARGWPVPTRGGRFELHGCDPAETYRVHFLDPTTKLGAVAEISPRKAGRDPVTVRLAPCGSAVVAARDFLDRPVRLPPNKIGVHLMITPGPFRLGDRANKVFNQGGLYAEEFELRRYLRDRKTEEVDDRKRTTFHYLIPGATYQLVWWVERQGFRHRPFSVKPGESLKLPDVVFAQGEVDP